MRNDLQQQNHRLVDTVRRELGPEYIRLFAPYFLSHGLAAGISGMILSCAASFYLLLAILSFDHFGFIFAIGGCIVIFSYTFPFQDMVMGKKNHLPYFKKYGIACTGITIPGVFIIEPAMPAGFWLDKGVLTLPVLVGIIFCWLLHSKKFAAMLAYQQKLWVIKARLIAEEKALVAELSQRTKKRAKK